MSFMHIDPMVPGSAGVRHYRGLFARGVQDAEAGRPRASEHEDYNEAYTVEAVKVRVRNGTALVAAAEGVSCSQCKSNRAGYLLACECEVRNHAHDVRGMYVIFAADPDYESAEFRSMAWIREFIADGTPAISPTGEDISHCVNPIQ